MEISLNFDDENFIILSEKLTFSVLLNFLRSIGLKKFTFSDFISYNEFSAI